MTLSNNYTVNGTIRDANGSTVSDAEVYGYSMMEKGDVVSTTTVTDGTYTFNIKNICSVNDDILIYTRLSSGYMDARSFTLNNDDTVNSFVLSDISDNGGEYSGIWVDSDDYIYVARYASNLAVYEFDGTALSLSSVTDVGNNAVSVHGDGTYIYTACQNNGLYAFSFDGTDLTSLGATDNGGNYNDVWADSNYIYVANVNEGLRVYSFDGTDFTLLDTRDDGGSYLGLWVDENYIYCACVSDGLRIYTFDGSNINLVAERDDGSGYYCIYLDDTYIYCSCGVEGLRVYTFDGSNITLVAERYDGGTYYGIYGDGDFIYCACDSAGLRAYSFDGTTLTLEDTQSYASSTRRVYCHESVIYAGCVGDGLAAYSFTFTDTVDITVDEYPTINITSDDYESRLRYCPIDNLDADLKKNIDVLNFWTNNIEAVDKDINKDSINISGVDYALTASDVPYLAFKFEQIWKMMDDDAEITIDTIDNAFNAVYVIKDFNINSIPKTGNSYMWNLNLEKVRDV